MDRATSCTPVRQLATRLDLTNFGDSPMSTSLGQELAVESEMGRLLDQFHERSSQSRKQSSDLVVQIPLTPPCTDTPVSQKDTPFSRSSLDIPGVYPVRRSSSHANLFAASGTPCSPLMKRSFDGEITSAGNKRRTPGTEDAASPKFISNTQPLHASKVIPKRVCGSPSSSPGSYENRGYTGSFDLPAMVPSPLQLSRATLLTSESDAPAMCNLSHDKAAFPVRAAESASIFDAIAPLPHSNAAFQAHSTSGTTTNSTSSLSSCGTTTTTTTTTTVVTTTSRPISRAGAVLPLRGSSLLNIIANTKHEAAGAHRASSQEPDSEPISLSQPQYVEDLLAARCSALSSRHSVQSIIVIGRTGTSNSPITDESHCLRPSAPFLADDDEEESDSPCVLLRSTSLPINSSSSAEWTPLLSRNVCGYSRCVLINPSELVMLLNQEIPPSAAGVIIIDCRYSFEFEGGHIRNANNISSKRQLTEMVFNNVSLRYQGSKENARRTRGSSSPFIIVFHCEYSQKRGPDMARYLRKIDRESNLNRYPHLFFPEVYVLRDGYRRFYNEAKEECGEYIRMQDPRFSMQLRAAKRAAMDEDRLMR